MALECCHERQWNIDVFGACFVCSFFVFLSCLFFFSFFFSFLFYRLTDADLHLQGILSYGPGRHAGDDWECEDWDEWVWSSVNAAAVPPIIMPTLLLLGSFKCTRIYKGLCLHLALIGDDARASFNEWLRLKQVVYLFSSTPTKEVLLFLFHHLFFFSPPACCCWCPWKRYQFRKSMPGTPLLLPPTSVAPAVSHTFGNRNIRKTKRRIE